MESNHLDDSLRQLLPKAKGDPVEQAALKHLTERM